MAAAVGYGFYASSVSWFKAHKSEEKITALQLVDAFVNNYAAVLTQLPSTAPVPASFRAITLTAFNKTRDQNDELSLQMVGVPGREIKTAPLDAEMAATIEAFTREPTPRPVSEVLRVNGQPVFRTIYPSVAGTQACVDCHNQLQAGKAPWHLNDVMGAFAIDVPMGMFLRQTTAASFGVAGAIFIALMTIGFTFSFYHYRKVEESEAAQARVAESEARFRDFAKSTSDWFWEQDKSAL